MRQLHGEIDRRGWMRMCWPREFGGEAKSPWYQYILFEELHAHGVPYTLGTDRSRHHEVRNGGAEEQVDIDPDRRTVAYSVDDTVMAEMESAIESVGRGVSVGGAQFDLR